MSATQADTPIVAAFDFDGTLTHRDTMFSFLLHVVGWRMFVRHVLLLAPTLAGYGLGLIRNDVAKERVFTRFFVRHGQRDSAIQSKAVCLTKIARIATCGRQYSVSTGTRSKGIAA
ncbi:MAG: hypothetical protein WDM70_10215 [Nitrosomonadales bacterium]